MCVRAKRYSDKRYLKHATARNTTGMCCLKMYFLKVRLCQNSGYVVNQLRITDMKVCSRDAHNMSNTHTHTQSLLNTFSSGLYF